MEGFGISELMKDMKNAGFIVDKICHDNDASTLKNVKDVFEDVEEVLCTSKNFKTSFNHILTNVTPGHGLKNLRRKLLTINNSPYFQVVVSKTIHAVRKALRECNGNESVFIDTVSTVQNHYTGIHNNCGHEITGVETIIVDPKLKQKYLVYNCCCFFVTA